MSAGDECAPCGAEIEEQLERMGRRRRPPFRPMLEVPAEEAPIPPALAAVATSPLCDVLLEVFAAAGELESVDRQDIGKAAVGFARAKGARGARRALVHLAAVAVKFASRLRPRTGGEHDSPPPRNPDGGILAGGVPVRLRG